MSVLGHLADETHRRSHVGNDPKQTLCCPEGPKSARSIVEHGQCRRSPGFNLRNSVRAFVARDGQQQGSEGVVLLKSGSLLRDDFRELVSSKPSQAAEEGTPLAAELITASEQRTTLCQPPVGVWLCVTFLSQTPQGMMFMLTKVGTLRSLRPLGFCAARATHPYRAHGTVTSVQVTA